MPDLSSLRVGDALPERTYAPGNVSLFLYNAAIWNAHRIHYDERFTVEHEGHPAVVVDGPLQGDWLTQTVFEWLGEGGELIELEYSNRRAAYVGDRLTSGGTVAAIDAASGEVELELHVRNAEGEVTTPGRARVHLRR